MLKLVLIAALISAVAWAAPATNFIEDDAVVAEQPSFNGFAAVLRGRNLRAATHNIFAQKIEPQNVKDLNDAIDLIIKDVVASHNASQTLINDSVKGFALCKGMPLTDKQSNDDAAAKFQLIEPAQTKEDTAAKGSVNYDFGKNADTSAVAVSGVEDAMKRLQGVFDAAVTSTATAQKNYDVAHKEAVKLGAGAKSSRDVCYCTARKAYTDAVKEAKTSNGNDRLDLQHFQMVQCVMAAFAKNTTEADAFKLCLGKKYDTKVMDLDFKESEAKLPSDVTCTTPAPTPAPEPPCTTLTVPFHGYVPAPQTGPTPFPEGLDGGMSNLADDVWTGLGCGGTEGHPSDCMRTEIFKLDRCIKPMIHYNGQYRRATCYDFDQPTHYTGRCVNPGWLQVFKPRGHVLTSAAELCASMESGGCGGIWCPAMWLDGAQQIYPGPPYSLPGKCKIGNTVPCNFQGTGGSTGIYASGKCIK